MLFFSFLFRSFHVFNIFLKLFLKKRIRMGKELIRHFLVWHSRTFMMWPQHTYLSTSPILFFLSLPAHPAPHNSSTYLLYLPWTHFDLSPFFQSTMFLSTSIDACEKDNFRSLPPQLPFVYYPKSNISGSASTQEDWQDNLSVIVFRKAKGVFATSGLCRNLKGL